MIYNINILKVRVIIAIAMTALVVVLVLTTNFIKRNVIVNKIHENIEQGSANLALGKVNEAKKNFEQAIYLKKENKETYIFIKEEYLKAGRLDDALSILKEGKNNRITGLESFINDYEKKIEMQVIVKPSLTVKSKQIGYISKVYEEGGKRYLRFDAVKFLTGKAAIEAAKQSGEAVYENGEYFVYDDYIIVNSSKEIKSYVMADNASLNLIGWWIDPVSGDINNHSISYDNFRSVSSKYENMLCYIYTENDVVVKVEGQYTP